MSSGVYLTPDKLARIAAAAESLGISEIDLVNDAVDEWIRTYCGGSHQTTTEFAGFTPKQVAVLRGLEKSGGILARACEEGGITHPAFYYWVKQSPQFLTAAVKRGYRPKTRVAATSQD